MNSIVHWCNMITGLENPMKHPAVEVVTKIPDNCYIYSGSKGQKEPIRAEDLRKLTQRFTGQQCFCPLVPSNPGA